MEFKEVKQLIVDHFKRLSNRNDQTQLFQTEVTKDEIYETYLNSYDDPDERQNHNCNCCRRFLRKYANIVFIGADYTLKSIWDINVPNEMYQKMCKDMSTLVLSRPIRDIFSAKERVCGTPISHQQSTTGGIITWNHFSLDMPSKFINNSTKSLPSIQSLYRSNKDVFKRGLEELTLESAKSVMSLIKENKLAQGNTYKAYVKRFIQYKTRYNTLTTDALKDAFCWRESKHKAIRNVLVGQLLQDLSEGKDFQVAMKAYAKMADPSAFMRTNQVYSKSMAEQGVAALSASGHLESLPRRFANLQDISVANTIFVDRTVLQEKGLLDMMLGGVKTNGKTFEGTQEIGIGAFIDTILPKTESMEMFFAGDAENHLMSLIVPQDKEAPSLFKWDNNSSWDHKGNQTGVSMRQRVKSAGGNIKGDLRFSIQWNDQGNNNIDLDAHCYCPGGHINFGHMNGSYGGRLDVDIQRPSSDNKSINGVAVENITWLKKSRMKDGVYTFKVHNYHGSWSGAGFSAEIEFDGKIIKFFYDKKIKGKGYIDVATVTLKNGKFTIENHLPTGSRIEGSRKVWGIETNKFHKVRIMSLSPNHWDDNNIGEKHYHFFLENCISDEPARGFYNEFLHSNLMNSRRFLDALGDRMKVEHTDDQLSGLGFGSTRRSSVIVKVKGEINRTLKVMF